VKFGLLKKFRQVEIAEAEQALARAHARVESLMPKSLADPLLADWHQRLFSRKRTADCAGKLLKPSHPESEQLLVDSGERGLGAVLSTPGGSRRDSWLNKRLTGLPLLAGRPKMVGPPMLPGPHAAAPPPAGGTPGVRRLPSARAQ